MTTSLTAFATTHGVIDRVHNNTAVARTTTEPAAATSLTANFEVVLGVGDDTDGGAASLENHTHLARGHLDDGILVVARHELCIGTCGANHLGTLTGAEFDVVDKGTEWDFGEGEGVADFGGNAIARFDFLTDLETLGSNDVAFLTVGIAHEGNAGTTVGVVLNGLDCGGDTVLVALEVDDTVEFLVTAADVALSHLTLVVAAAGLAEADYQALLRLGSGDVIVGNDEFVALAGGCGFNLF